MRAFVLSLAHGRGAATPDGTLHPGVDGTKAAARSRRSAPAPSAPDSVAMRAGPGPVPGPPRRHRPSCASASASTDDLPRTCPANTTSMDARACRAGPCARSEGSGRCHHRPPTCVVPCGFLRCRPYAAPRSGTQSRRCAAGVAAQAPLGPHAGYETVCFARSPDWPGTADAPRLV